MWYYFQTKTKTKIEYSKTQYYLHRKIVDLRDLKNKLNIICEYRNYIS